MRQKELIIAYHELIEIVADLCWPSQQEKKNNTTSWQILRRSTTLPGQRHDWFNQAPLRFPERKNHTVRVRVRGLLSTPSLNKMKINNYAEVQVHSLQQMQDFKDLLHLWNWHIWVFVFVLVFSPRNCCCCWWWCYRCLWRWHSDDDDVDRLSDRVVPRDD